MLTAQAPFSSLGRVGAQVMGGRRSGDGRSVAKATESEMRGNSFDGAVLGRIIAEGILVNTVPPA